jgi:hypothetical protein
MALDSGKVRVHGWLVAMVLAACGAAVVAEQRAVPPPTTAESLETAREVRALRGELQRVGSDIVAAHAVVGRLQLIDRRMSFLAGQLADVRRELALQQSRREQPLKALDHAEAGIASGATGFDQVIAQARSDLAAIEQVEGALRARAAQFQSQMKSEEQRWAALSARLDQLDGSGPR